MHRSASTTIQYTFLSQKLIYSDLNQMDPSSKNIQEIEKHHQKCACKEIEYLPREWIHTKCPFRIADLQQYIREGKNILLPIYCRCGKQVGEMMFAGKKHVGCWRCYEVKGENIAMRNIQDWLCLSYDEEMKTVSSSMVELQRIIKRIRRGLGQQ